MIIKILKATNITNNKICYRKKETWTIITKLRKESVILILEIRKNLDSMNINLKENALRHL